MMKKLTVLLLLFLYAQNSSSQAPSIQWQKCFGGSSFDNVVNIIKTSDGNYAFLASTTSSNGDLTDNNGSYDYWIVKISSNGTLLWQKNYGGSNVEQAAHLQQTSDGGYIIVGKTQSNDHDVSGLHGSAGVMTDGWVIKLNAVGNLQWQKALGGGQHESLYFVRKTADNG
jgi:hypothetical protein